MILIKNGHVKTMSGPDIIGGDVLIENGKIKAVGKNLSAEGATVIDAAGRLVTPGFVEAHCHIGLDNEAMGWEGHDYNEIVEPCTPQLRAIDSINPIDEAFMNAVKGGVTTAVTGPGSANVIGGTFVAIKLYGKRVDNMIVKNPVAMKVAFGENPKRCYSNMKKSPSTRMATAALLREMLFKTKRYMEDKEEAEKNGTKAPAFDMKLEAMIPVLKRRSPSRPMLTGPMISSPRSALPANSISALPSITAPTAALLPTSWPRKACLPLSAPPWAKRAR